MKAVAIRLLAYLAKNPRASDSVESIRIWWLRDAAGKRPSRETVGEAIEELLGLDLIVALPQQFGPTNYSLNHERIDEVLEHISKHRENGS